METGRKTVKKISAGSEGDMRIFKIGLVVLVLSAMPLHAADSPNSALGQIVDHIISTEQSEVQTLKPFTPLVETYIQNLREDNTLGPVPAGDHYFLGRALLANGVNLEPLTGSTGAGGGVKHKVFGNLGSLLSLSMEFMPQGFLQYAFFDRLLFDEKDTFRHFGFARTQAEDEAADAKANELLRNSPYKDQLDTAKLFLNAVQSRKKDIPNLISPHLGDRVPVNMAVVAAAAPPAQPSAGLATQPRIVALPLGGRVKMDPWSDKLEMLKSKPVGILAEREKMPFEITPFMLYLTSEVMTNRSVGPAEPVSEVSKSVTVDKVPQQ